MRYVIRTVLGMAIFAFCWMVIGYSINQLLSVGTCASGGPYVVARECPENIEYLMFALIGAVFLLFANLAIYGTRGTPPGGRPPSNGGVIVWFWTGLFWSLAVGCFLAVWGPDANPGPGGKEGGLIVGFMGLLMGAGGLLVLKMGWTGDKKKRRKPFRPAVAKIAGAASSFSGQANPVDRLATLDRLRDQGTLTDAEFETLKQKIVRER